MKNIYTGIMNLSRYFRIIWNDRDWDYAYLMELIAFKLERMERSIREDPYHFETARRARPLRVCRAALERLNANDFMSEEWNAYFKLYPMEFIDAGDGHMQIIDYGPKAASVCTKLIEDTEKARLKEEARFWRIFRNYYNSWWS